MSEHRYDYCGYESEEAFALDYPEGYRAYCAEYDGHPYDKGPRVGPFDDLRPTPEQVAAWDASNRVSYRECLGCRALMMVHYLPPACPKCGGAWGPYDSPGQSQPASAHTGE